MAIWGLVTILAATVFGIALTHRGSESPAPAPPAPHVIGAASGRPLACTQRTYNPATGQWDCTIISIEPPPGQ